MINFILNKKQLVFSYNGIINNITCFNILFIEKVSNQNYCIIYTIDEEYIIKETINNFEKKLENPPFLKTHRSCIINIYNIISYDYSKNIIRFKSDKKCYLIAREKKKILKEKLINIKK